MESVSSSIGLFELLALVLLGFGVLGTIFWAWMLVEWAIKEPDKGNTKIVCAIIIVFTHVAGTALYFFFVRRPRRRAEAAS